MKPQTSKLQQQSQAELATQHQQQAEQQTTAHEFQSPEAMLRADVAQTVVPEAVKIRLADSVSKEPTRPQPHSWWRRLLS